MFSAAGSAKGSAVVMNMGKHLSGLKLVDEMNA